jgi:chemotaxis family two-component system response regulator Rcp1
LGRGSLVEERRLNKNVLLVEDQSGDARLTQEAFRSAAAFITLHTVCDGIEALAFQRNPPQRPAIPPAYLILLDLNLPGLDGRGLLAELKGDSDLSRIPVVVLTASDTPGDVEKCYEMGASCFLNKPEEWDPYEILVQSIINFWLTDPPLKMLRRLPAAATAAS